MGGPGLHQRCRSARPLSRQAQPVVASRIAMQRSGEELSTNREKESNCHFATVKKLQLLNSHGMPWHRADNLPLAWNVSS